MTQLFISYSRKDIAFARRLAGDLEKAGYVVWWDITDLRGGDYWVRVIPEAIEKSEAVIVVLSPDSTASEWVPQGIYPGALAAKADHPDHAADDVRALRPQHHQLHQFHR